MTALLTITIPFGPVALQAGPVTIRWYGLTYALGVAVGCIVAIRYGLRHGVSGDLIYRILLWGVIWGLLGGRLYYVVQNGLGWYLTHPAHILAIWEGGTAFFGAIFTDSLFLIYMAWRHRLSFWLLIDGGVLFAAAGQPVGRIGNVMNGEILGPRSNLPWAFMYTNPHSMAPQLGVAYQPAAAYEALAVLLILGILLWLQHRGIPVGGLGVAYFALYPISQLIVFIWRTDGETPIIWHGLRQGQLTSIAVLLFVLPPMVLLWRSSLRIPPSFDAPHASALS